VVGSGYVLKSFDFHGIRLRSKVDCLDSRIVRPGLESCMVPQYGASSLLLLPQDVMGPNIPEQHDLPLPLEGDPVALGHAHLPDIPHPFQFLHLERGMPGIILV